MSMHGRQYPFAQQTFEEFLQQAEQDENHRRYARGDGLRFPRESTTKERKWYVIWWTTLVIMDSFIVSGIISLIFVVREARRSRPTPAHVTWLILSSAFALLSGTLLWPQHHRRQLHKRRKREAQAYELTEHLQRLERIARQEQRDREVEQRALMVTARISQHSSQELEGGDRCNPGTCSDRGTPHLLPGTASTAAVSKLGDTDLHPTTNDDRQERKQARRPSSFTHKLKATEFESTANESQVLDCERQGEVDAHGERMYRRRENVANWIEKQRRSGREQA
ncbi:MAG: hypothetical protein M1817_002970 [Caeruleum heppii]|nr:MAG: hypothetical protein M1817_002970 [Caeruleum heppii]